MGWSRGLASKPTTSFLRLESPSKRWKSKKDLWRIGYKRWIYMNLLIILHECKYQFLNTTPFSGISFFNLLCWLRIKSGVSRDKINDSESSWGSITSAGKLTRCRESREVMVFLWNFLIKDPQNPSYNNQAVSSKSLESQQFFVEVTKS